MAIATRWEEKREFLAALEGSAPDATVGLGRRRLVRDVLVLLGLAAVYFIVGKLGLKLAYFHPSATAVWPPTGIALVAVLMLGYRIWPVNFLGALLVNLTTPRSLPVCLGIASGQTLPGLLGTNVLKKFAGGESAFGTRKGVLAFVLYAALISTTVSATFGATSLALGGLAPWANYRPIWLTWWMGDTVGDLLVVPLLVLWS